jgi:hypothetical protein
MKRTTYEQIKLLTSRITIYFAWGTIALGLFLCGYALMTLECIWALFGIFCFIISVIPYITLYNGIVSDPFLFNINNDDR